jgi:hypothetical protein
LQSELLLGDNLEEGEEGAVGILSPRLTDIAGLRGIFT